MGNKKKRLAESVMNDSRSSSITHELNDMEMPVVGNNTQSVDSIEIKQESDIKQEPLTDVELVEIPASVYWNVAHVHDFNTYSNLNEAKVEMKKECDEKKAKELKTNDSAEEAPGDKQNEPPTQGPDDLQQPDGRNDENNTMERSGRVHGNKSKPHKCESCEYSTRYKYSLKQHMLKHTGEKPQGCDFCPKRFTSKRSFQAHMKTHVEELLFHCRSCLQGFNEKDTKMAHEASCMVLRYECHICKDSFGSSRADMINHMRVHSGDRPFECKECFKQFARKSDLKRHNKQHDGPRSFRCSKCRQGFSREDEQIMHEEKCNRQTYECDVCGKSFGLKKFNLIGHMRTHTGEKPFGCKECPKKFTWISSLKRHSKIHTNKLQFKCLICHQGFLKDDKRKVHQRSCNGRYYECHLCNKFFGSRKINLVEHMRTHSGEKPFQCQLCKNRFMRKGSLNRHMNRFHKMNL